MEENNEILEIEEQFVSVYLIDENGFFITKTVYNLENFNKDVMIKVEDAEKPYKFLKPKWIKKSKKWKEGFTKKQLSERLEGLKEEKKSANRSQVRTLCLEVAEEIEQSNWLNFPEDYDPEEVEELKNQIREIRAKGRDIRAKIDASESLEELSELDLNMVELPEPEVSEEPSEEEPRVYENLEELYDEKLQENPEVVEDQPEDTGE